MALSQEQITSIKNVLLHSLRRKFQDYKPEPASKPFHTRLLGKDRMVLFSFIQSLNTNFGTSIYEPVALALASSSFTNAALHQSAGTQISSGAQRVIQNIMDGLATANSSPNKPNEISAIRAVCRQGVMKAVKPTKVDIKLVAHSGTIYLFDIKTAKPNIGNFKEFKRTLLEWTAAALAIDPMADIQSLIAIPYNPYEPKPYSRWTIRGMLDLDNELRVANEFWDFIGGKGTYDDLLNIFEQVGIELRPEIDNYFAKYNQPKSL